jgi:3-dehydroquinate synthase
MGDLLMPDVLRVKSRLRDYQVQFVPDCARAIGDQRNTKAFLIIDENLPFISKLAKFFDNNNIIYFKANEHNKTLGRCSSLMEKLVTKNIRRNNVIFAVGGGVLEDVVAFVSTVLFRGVEWVFCPTTLLAQADSCIGSKSSINFGSYKNLLGSFNPPAKVLIDVNFLKSLSPQQIKSGLGEILHFYLVAGKVKLAARMMAQHKFFLKNPAALKPFILVSLKIKKAVIEKDELDRGERQLFNYGHTFGHAIETISNYRISHGEAVSMGMDMANYVSWQNGYISEKIFWDLHHILERNIPAYQIKAKQWPQYLQALSKDKKNIGTALGCILTRGPGKMFRTQLPFDDHLNKTLVSYFGNR